MDDRRPPAAGHGCRLQAFRRSGAPHGCKAVAAGVPRAGAMLSDRRRLVHGVLPRRGGRTPAGAPFPQRCGAQAGSSGLDRDGRGALQRGPAAGGRRGGSVPDLPLTKLVSGRAHRVAARCAHDPRRFLTGHRPRRRSTGAPARSRARRVCRCGRNRPVLRMTAAQKRNADSSLTPAAGSSVARRDAPGVTGCGATLTLPPTRTLGVTRKNAPTAASSRGEMLSALDRRSCSPRFRVMPHRAVGATGAPADRGFAALHEGGGSETPEL